MMQEDIDLTQKTTSGPEYDKAIEILSASINPMKSREANRKKALSIKDLLIKVSTIARWIHTLIVNPPAPAYPENHAIRAVVQGSLQTHTVL